MIHPLCPSDFICIYVVHCI